MADRCLVEDDTCVREREDRDDQIARPRVEDLLQALVRGDGGAEPLLRDPRQLGRRLLAEGAEALGGALELRPRRRVGERDQPEDEADHDRVDARLEDCDPDGGGDRQAGSVANPCGASHQQSGEDRDPDEQRPRLDVSE